ncbi:hypothetical protein AWZ03_011212 [Drosophila navojoa]|uniref:Phosphoinositide 5-phosphatase n=2 Tax=Drosophila navojoa TaxID=7232 RepID=A0A484B0V9_DRONA|nr:type II inositol 1,4,5-trisphosphate 5-phosphatase isoform X1 [Drosophila navojoa]TDG42358.1 hypothetical protein AWZ03_011212 [Drosophila navojoa]
MERGSNYPNGGDASAAAVPVKTTLSIVQERFKADETVHLIFEAYQIKGQEHIEGLLALVSSASGGTYAIISFSLLRNPLTASNDLKINKVFPINASFKLTTDSKAPKTEQFDLCTDDDRPTKYYYYSMRTDPAAVDFNEFCAKVNSCKKTMWDAELPSEAALNFRWLDDYREIGEVKHELKKRESEYIIYKDIIVYCATWNVNNKPCWDNKNTLRPWLASGKKAPDIYAIGLQELENTARAMLNGNQMQMFATQWVRKMLENLHDDMEYEELQSVRLSGIMLTIFVRKNLRQHIVRCRVNSVARGVFNTLGNKGGVAVSFQLNEASICFVNSHLAAHMGNVAERNDDYKAIDDYMRFEENGLQVRTINDHDHIFWLGDLNYRIQEPNGQQRPGPMSDAQTFELMLQYDQLRTEMSYERCFKGYTEGEIKFAPTYKYDVGTDTYDTGEKQRAPAYCDRVLWKGKLIEQLEYNGVMEIRESDHKPVYAIFRVKIKTRDDDKYRKVLAEVLKAVDKRENDSQPQITTDRLNIEFGVVRFNEPAIRDFNVSNDCPQNVDFEFKVKDSHNDICEKWLHVDPRGDSLMIDSARSIRVRALVDANSVTGLLKMICTAVDKCVLDILILHVRSGRDIFITVTGEYQPSCFGLSMETLCRTERPIGEYTLDEVKQLMLDVTPGYRVPMPREYFLLIDYLHNQRGQLFQSYDRRQPLSSQFNAVRDWLDSWSNDPFPGTPQTAAEALLLLLDLPEQALLEPFVDDLLASRSKVDAERYIDLLSDPKRNVFKHLCLFLCDGVERGDYDANNVATIFGRILLRSSKCNVTIDYHSRCNEFMQRFIRIESPDTLSGGNGHGGASLQT